MHRDIAENLRAAPATIAGKDYASDGHPHHTPPFVIRFTAPERPAKRFVAPRGSARREM